MAQLLSLRDRNPLFSIFFLTALAVFFLGLSVIISSIIIQLIWGIPVLTDPNALSDFSKPDVINALKLFQSITAIGIFIIPCYVFLKLAEEKPSVFLKMNAFPSITSLLFAILIILAVQPFIVITGIWNAEFPFPEVLGIAEWIRETEEQAAVVTVELLKADSVPVLLLNIFIVALIPAFGEEIFFRGMIQRFMIKAVKNMYIGIIITAILFSAFHFQFMGFVPRMLLGIILGCVFAWSGNIWLAIFIHFLNNGLGVTLNYLSQHGFINEEQLESTASDNVTILVFSIVLTGMFMYGLYRKNMGLKTYT